MTLHSYKVYPLKISLSPGAKIETDGAGQTGYFIDSPMRDSFMYMAESYTISESGIVLSGHKYMRYDGEMNSQDVNAKDYASGFTLNEGGTKGSIYRVNTLMYQSMNVNSLFFNVIGGTAKIEVDKRTPIYSFTAKEGSITTGMKSTLTHSNISSFYVEDSGPTNWEGYDKGYEVIDQGYVWVYNTETIESVKVSSFDGKLHRISQRSPSGSIGWYSPKSDVGNLEFNKYKYRILYRMEDSKYSKVKKVELDETKLADGLNKDNINEIFYLKDPPPKIYGSYLEYKVCRMLINQSPQLILQDINNETLYEKDILSIQGNVIDTNEGDTVTVRYQINSGTPRAITAYLSDGTKKEFSKTLTFKAGALYDGDTLVADALKDGDAHLLKVWATDDKGGQSAIVERTFYVVPNRAPRLEVTPPTIEGNIDSDTFTVSGTYADDDKNEVIISYRINGSISKEVARGTDGTFDFTLSLAQLKNGNNTISVEAIDSYGAKTSRTIKLNKNTIATPLLQSTVRYLIQPPKGSAQAVLLWLQRDQDLAVTASLHMGMKGEAEAFTLLEPTNTAPLRDNAAILEDEFYHEADSAKDHIILQLDMKRSSVESTAAIHLISGVFE